VVVRRRADDAVDLHCHGGLAALAMIEEALAAAGCQRLAWRDWAAKSCDDLIAAAAIAALADARTERTAAILLDQYHGAFDRELREIRQAIDRGLHDAAKRQIDRLLGRADLGRHLVQPWRVVLAGPVNAGKSSLINALAGYDRSIVHHAPGTTRDSVTVATAIDGWPVELCDTAGLRCGGDAVERAGIERTHQRLAEADLALLVFDRNRPWSAADQAVVDRWPEALWVHNKCDLPAAVGDRPAGLRISALRGDGLGNLLAAIANRLAPDPPPSGAAVPFTPDQIKAVHALLTGT
jgi:tRNA modification GTPase